MEEENVVQEESSSQEEQPRVGFPQPSTEKKYPWKTIVIVIVVLVFLGGGGWFLFRRSGLPSTKTPTPTPYVAETPTPVPTEASIDRSEVKIQILNGTGFAAAASSLKTQLESLGYSGIEVGNASPQNYVKTQITFADEVSQEVKDEILSKLTEIYQNVEEKPTSLGDFDVKIITGYPKGHTPTPTTKPKASPTPTPRVGATGTSTPTSGVTGTPTISPSPTP